MSIRIALFDAATNCSRDRAKATLTLSSGVQFIGELEKPSVANAETVQIRTTDGGWTTVLIDELVAVGAHRR